MKIHFFEKCLPIFISSGMNPITIVIQRTVRTKSIELRRLTGFGWSARSKMAPSAGRFLIQREFSFLDTGHRVPKLVYVLGTILAQKGDNQGVRLSTCILISVCRPMPQTLPT